MTFRRTMTVVIVTATLAVGLTHSSHAFLDTGTLLNAGAAAIKGFTMGEGHEVQMGNEYYAQYLQQSGGAHPDQSAQEALRKFAAPLIATSKRQGLPWEITLVKSDQVNAWALPGGKLAINAAIVRLADDPNELASVIAHEIGHAELSHGLSQMRNQTFMSAAGSVAKSALVSQLGAAAPLGSEVLRQLEGPLYQLINSGYSRANELEADQHILTVFAEVGMDPAKAEDFFHKLQKVHGEGSEETTSLFSTHPGTAQRIKELEASAAKVGGHGQSRDLPGWAELKALFPTPVDFRNAQ